jgi:hypothetical protein
VVEAEAVFEFAVVVRDAPADLREPDELAQRHVVVVCQETPPACKIRRRVSRLSSATMPSSGR